MLFDILALISIIITISLLKRLVNIFPSLMAGMIRWKENSNLQISLKMRTDRNLLAAAMFIPFCLTAYRFSMYSPGFMEGFSENAKLGATSGVFAAYVAFRAVCSYIFRSRKLTESTYRTAIDSARTYFIILVLLLTATGGVLTFLEVPELPIRTAMIWISGAMYLVFIIRKTQIFYSSCSIFASFLYLCALEILPTGVLIASAVIF